MKPRRRSPSSTRSTSAAAVATIEYSVTDYFGDEASDSAFYAAAAILFDDPPTSARECVAAD